VDGGLEQLREIYERSHRRLWRSLLAFSGDRDVADEAVAEAFAQAARRGEALDDVEAWIWRSAFAVARGELARRHSRRAPCPDMPRMSLPEYTHDVVALLGALDLRDREVLVLRYVADMSHAEIAARCEISPAAARVRLHRATARARALLEGHR
jgi:RNA polymerase sigma-70 factor (ECF subfamily)